MKSPFQFIKWMAVALLLGFVMLHPAQQARAADFTVNVADDEDDGICDSAHCSLREAIIAANDADGKDRINFDISGAGVHTIQPTSGLPPVTDPIMIDGTTQPDFTDHPLIEIDGSAAGAGVNGLAIFAGGSTVKGLIVNRFTFAGIFLGLGGGNTIVGNYIGTTADGSESAANRDGVYLFQSHDNVIGGTTSEARNVISGNWDDGVNPNTANGTIIQGNYIGTSADGAGKVGNSGDGIKIDAHSNNTQVGGEDGANRIAYNAGRGVYMEANGDNPSTGSHVSENEIYDNGGLGIDLGGDGVSDIGDGDIGPNNLQDFPVLTTAEITDAAVLIEGTLSNDAGLEYRLEFFTNDACDDSGYGEGQIFIGATTITTDTNGEGVFRVELMSDIVVGQYVTATATDADNNTSEFSACVEAVAASG